MVKGKEDKLKQLEEKKAKELEELIQEYLKTKKEGLVKIKERFNELALQVKVDS